MRAASKLVFFSFLALAFFGVSSDSYADDPHQDFINGTELLRQNDIDGAIDALKLAIDALEKTDGRSDDQNKLLAEALNNRGLAYMEKGQYGTAEEDFKAAKGYDSEDTKPGNNLGLLYYNQARDYEDSGQKENAANFFAKAIEEYQAALEMIPEGSGFEAVHADIFSNMGVSYAKKDPPEYAKALESYTKAIEIATTSPEDDLSARNVKFTMAYYNRGNLYYNLNQYKNAIADYTKAIEFFEKAEEVKSDVYGYAHYNRGLCYYNQGQYQEAINDYARSIELNPSYTWAYYAKGFAHYMLGQDNLAEQAYQKVIAPGEAVLDTDEKAHVKFGYGLVYVRKKVAGQNNFDTGMGYLKEACNSGRCQIACQAVEQGLFADPGTILVFELPK